MSRRISSEHEGEGGFTMIEAVDALALVAVIGRLVASNSRSTRAVIMISGPGEKEAFRVLAWLDEIDPDRGGRRRPAENR